jgi:porphobilinogen synthase
VVMESLVAFKRAGADLILTYFTEDVLKVLK